MRFDASPRPEKGVCHLQGLARTPVAVDALSFGQIWFRSVKRVRRTGILENSWASGPGYQKVYVVQSSFSGSGWGAGAKTFRTTALSLIYSTDEYCAPAWFRNAYTRLIDSVLNDVLRIVTGCLRPTPTDKLSVLSCIQPAKLRRQGAILFLANRSSLNPGHILHGQQTEPLAASEERLKSRHPFVPAAWKLWHNLSELGIRTAQWTNLTWDTEYSKSTSALCVWIPMVNTRSIGMSLTRTA